MWGSAWPHKPRIPVHQAAAKAWRQDGAHRDSRSCRQASFELSRIARRPSKDHRRKKGEDNPPTLYSSLVMSYLIHKNTLTCEMNPSVQWVKGPASLGLLRCRGRQSTSGRVHVKSFHLRVPSSNTGNLICSMTFGSSESRGRNSCSLPSGCCSRHSTLNSSGQSPSRNRVRVTFA